MNTIKFELYNPTRPFHVALAEEAAAIQADAEQAGSPLQMLALNPSSMAAHPLGVIAHSFDKPNRPFAAYNAVTAITPDSMGGIIIEVGGLLVAPELRGQKLVPRLKNELFPRIIQTLVPEIIKMHGVSPRVITFCNQSSESINRGLGFVDVLNVPSVCFEPCSGCPKQQVACAAGKLCCDTILEISLERLAAFPKEIHL